MLDGFIIFLSKKRCCMVKDYLEKKAITKVKYCLKEKKKL